MIQFLVNKSDGKRGGEYFHANLHSLIIRRFPGTLPKIIEKLPLELNGPIRHAQYNRTIVRNLRPRLIIVDVSSGIRNVLAVRWMKKHRGKILVVILGQRMAFRYNNKLVEYIVRRCENYLLKSADIILTNSEYTAGFAKRYISKHAGLIIANPGLEIDQVQDIALENAYKSVSPTRLLFVGECTKVKGLRYLIEALGLLKDLDIQLDIAGDYDAKSSYYASIKKIVNMYSIQKNVNFHGFVHQPRLTRLFQACSIFVMPSLSEGYGKALAEAFLFGLPVVASRAGNIPALAKDKVNALLVEPGNTKDLAHAIRQLLIDPELRKAMSKANLEKAKTLPTWADFHKILDEELVPTIEKLTGLKARR